MNFPANFQTDLLLPRFAKEKFARSHGDHEQQAAAERLAVDRAPAHRKRVWDGDREFNIHLSRISAARELLHESMLTYTQRMADSKRSRNLHLHGAPSPKPGGHDPSSLLVRATHISRQSADGRADPGARSPTSRVRIGIGGVGAGLAGHAAGGGGGTKAKSLPNIKLEPLLGNNEKYKLRLPESAGLKDILGLRHIADRRLEPVIVSVTAEAVKPIAGADGASAAQALIKDLAFESKVVQSMRQSAATHSGFSDSGAASEKRRAEAKFVVKLKVGLPNGEARTMEDKDRSGVDESAQNDGSADGEPRDYGTFVVVESDRPTPKIKNVTLGGRRSKKLKRMKINPPNLSSIPEDEQEEFVDADAAASFRKHQGFRRIPLPHILDVIGESDGSYEEPVGAKIDGIEDRRKDTAILRRVNSIESPQQTRQKSMVLLAKRKLRKLPPLGAGD